MRAHSDQQGAGVVQLANWLIFGALAFSLWRFNIRADTWWRRTVDDGKQTVSFGLPGITPECRGIPQDAPLAAGLLHVSGHTCPAGTHVLSSPVAASSSTSSLP